jgi:hypothetical protein
MDDSGPFDPCIRLEFHYYMTFSIRVHKVFNKCRYYIFAVAVVWIKFLFTAMYEIVYGRNIVNIFKNCLT